MPTKQWQDAMDEKIRANILKKPLTIEEVAERWRASAKKAAHAVETIMEEELQKALEKLR